MKLRSRTEGNTTFSAGYQEHLTQIGDLLSPLSLAVVKVARLRARREHGADKNNR